jgi:hypothetical protein
MSFEKNGSVASFSIGGRLARKILAGAALAAILPVLHSNSASASIADIYGDPTASGSVAGIYTETGTVSAVLDVFTSKGVTSNTFIIQDGTAGLISFSIPETDYTATVGDNITVTAVNSPFDGSPELTKGSGTLASPTYSAVINSTGNAAPSTLLTLPQFNSAGNGSLAVPPYAEELVTLDNVTFPAAPASLVAGTKSATSLYTIDDSSSNTADLFAYSGDSNVAAAIAAANTANPGGFGGTYDVTGYADVFFGVPELYPLSITAVAVPEPVGMSFLAVAGISLLARRRRSSAC